MAEPNEVFTGLVSAQAKWLREHKVYQDALLEIWAADDAGARLRDIDVPINRRRRLEKRGLCGESNSYGLLYLWDPRLYVTDLGFCALAESLGLTE